MGRIIPAPPKWEFGVIGDTTITHNQTSAGALMVPYLGEQSDTLGIKPRGTPGTDQTNSDPESSTEPESGCENYVHCMINNRTDA